VLLEEAPDPGSFSASAMSEPSSAGMGVARSSWPNTPPLSATTSAPMAIACRRTGSMSARVLGRSWEKRLLVDLVRLLHTLDGAEQVLGRGTLGIERHDDAAGDGI